jgi:hypothetical protein
MVVFGLLVSRLIGLKTGRKQASGKIQDEESG